MANLLDILIAALNQSPIKPLRTQRATPTDF